MRNDYIHITMVIDKSGSMYQSRQDVVGGVQKIIDEQKSNKNGKCTISLYTFNDKVNEVFVGKDVNDVEDFKYSPDGMTAMNDGLGVAIDNTGKWLAAMNEEDRPGKVMVAVFTDGMENYSREYTLKQVQDKIKEQTEKYSWEFVYLGTDITTTKAADDLGFKFKTYSSRKKLGNNYDIINTVTSCYRSMAATGATMDSLNETFSLTMDAETTKNTADFEKEIGKKITNI
jgi:uncharacterized protein YegL